MNEKKQNCDRYFVDKLEQWLKIKGLTQKELSEMTGLHPSHLSRIMNHIAPGEGAKLRILKALNLTEETFRYSDLFSDNTLNTYQANSIEGNRSLSTADNSKSIYSNREGVVISAPSAAIVAAHAAAQASAAAESAYAETFIKSKALKAAKAVAEATEKAVNFIDSGSIEKAKLHAQIAEKEINILQTELHKLDFQNKESVNE